MQTALTHIPSNVVASEMERINRMPGLVQHRERWTVLMFDATFTYVGGYESQQSFEKLLPDIAAPENFYMVRKEDLATGKVSAVYVKKKRVVQH